MEHVLHKEDYKNLVTEFENLKSKKMDEAKHGYVTFEEQKIYGQALDDALRLLRTIEKKK